MNESFTPKNDNVIYLDFNSQSKEDVSYDKPGEVVSLRGRMSGETFEGRRAQVEYFIHDNLDRLNNLTDIAQGYMTGQLLKYEQGKAGDDSMVLDDVLSDLENMIKNGDIDDFFSNQLRFEVSMNKAKTKQNEAKKDETPAGRSKFTVIDGGLLDK